MRNAPARPSPSLREGIAREGRWAEHSEYPEDHKLDRIVRLRRDRCTRNAVAAFAVHGSRHVSAAIDVATHGTHGNHRRKRASDTLWAGQSAASDAQCTAGLPVGQAGR